MEKILMDKIKEYLPAYFSAIFIMGLAVLLRERMGNISYYIVICISYLFLSCGFFFLLKKKEINSFAYSLLMISSVFAWIIANWIVDKHEKWYFLQWFRYQIPGWMFFGMIAIFMILASGSLKTSGCNRANRLIISVLYSIITGAFLYPKNGFWDLLGFEGHIHAYFASISSTLWYQPYDGANHSIYGFYGLFYLIPVKILHHLFHIDLYNAVFLVIAFVGVVTLLAAAYVIDAMTEKDTIFYLGLLATGTICYEIYRWGLYIQAYPHRMIFPMLIMAAITYLSKHGESKKKWQDWMLWIMAALGIVWNFEIGMVGVIVVLVYFLQREVAGDAQEAFIHEIAKHWKEIGICIFKAITSVVASYIVVGLWNCFTGGSFLTIKQFIYPIGDANYTIADLALPLEGVEYSWFGIVMVMLFVVAISVNRILHGRKLGGKNEILFCAALMGLGVFTYYINRAATGNLAIIFLELIIVMTGILDRCVQEKDSGTVKETMFQKGAYIVVLFQLCVWALNPMVSFKEAVTKRLDANWNKEKLEQLEIFLQEIEKNVPEGTPGFGITVPELYAMLDRNPQIHVMDFEDIVLCPEAIWAARQQVMENEYILATEYGMAVLGINDNYEILQVFQYDWLTYLYCRRIE